eukprot:7424860-Alexandrium_andersonii.AAC.1
MHLAHGNGGVAASQGGGGAQSALDPAALVPLLIAIAQALQQPDGLQRILAAIGQPAPAATGGKPVVDGNARP